MRYLLAIGAGLLLLTTSPAAGFGGGTLSMPKAKFDARQSARWTLSAFTESDPQMTLACHRVSPVVVICNVKARGDRAAIGYHVRIVGTTVTAQVYASGLHRLG